MLYSNNKISLVYDSVDGVKNWSKGGLEKPIENVSLHDYLLNLVILLKTITKKGWISVNYVCAYKRQEIG